MPKRIKLKSAKEPGPKKAAVVHDRRVESLPYNAKVAIDTVDDPYGIEESADIGPRGEVRSIGRPQVQVIRSLRDDTVSALYAAQQITRIQRDAGHRWEGWFHLSEVGPIKAIDWIKDKVDGGRMAEPIAGRALYGQEMLQECRKALGHEGDRLVRDILGVQRMSLRQAAEARGVGNEAGRKYIGRRFRECLDSIAKVAGLVTESAA